MLNRAQLRKVARRKVHATFGVPVVLIRKGQSTPVILQNPLTARIHNRLTVDPDSAGQAGAGIVDAATRVLMNTEELASNALTLAQGDRLMFPDYGITVTLDVKDVPNGPIVERWTVQAQPKKR